MTSCSWTQPTIANSSARWAWTKIALFAKPLWMYLPSSFAPFYAFLQSIIWFTYFIAVMINIIEVKITTSLAVSRLNWGKWHFTLSDSLWSEQIKAGRLSRVLTLSRTSWNQSKSECWVCPSVFAHNVDKNVQPFLNILQIIKDRKLGYIPRDTPETPRQPQFSCEITFI